MNSILVVMNNLAQQFLVLSKSCLFLQIAVLFVIVTIVHSQDDPKLHPPEPADTYIRVLWADHYRYKLEESPKYSIRLRKCGNEKILQEIETEPFDNYAHLHYTFKGLTPNTCYSFSLARRIGNESNLNYVTRIDGYTTYGPIPQPLLKSLNFDDNTSKLVLKWNFPESNKLTSDQRKNASYEICFIRLNLSFEKINSDLLDAYKRQEETTPKVYNPPYKSPQSSPVHCLKAGGPLQKNNIEYKYEDLPDFVRKESKAYAAVRLTMSLPYHLNSKYSYELFSLYSNQEKIDLPMAQNSSSLSGYIISIVGIVLVIAFILMLGGICYTKRRKDVPVRLQQQPRKLECVCFPCASSQPPPPTSKHELIT